MTTNKSSQRYLPNTCRSVPPPKICLSSSHFLPLTPKQFLTSLHVRPTHPLSPQIPSPQVTALTFSHFKLPMIFSRPSTSNFTHIFPFVHCQYLSTVPQVTTSICSPLHLPCISPTSFPSNSIPFHFIPSTPVEYLPTFFSR